MAVMCRASSYSAPRMRPTRMPGTCHGAPPAIQPPPFAASSQTRPAACLGEVHGDVAAAEESVANHEVAGEEHGEDGNDPDPRRPFRQMDFRLGSGLLPLPPFVHVVVLAHDGTPAVFHISFGSNSRTA